jgi:hypothetical protein
LVGMNSRNFHSNSQEKRARMLPKWKPVNPAYYGLPAIVFVGAAARFKALLLHIGQVAEN